MSVARRFVRRVRNAVLPGRAEAELSRELEAHLALLEDRFRTAGMSADAAAAAARRELGVDRTRELHRDARSFVWLEDLRRDVRYALRVLGRTPGFTGLAVLTLALGIGSVTVIYSVIHNVLLDPLPYPDADRLVNVVVYSPAGRYRAAFLEEEFDAYRDGTTVFEGVVGTRGDAMLVEAHGQSDVVRAVSVTPNFFDFMGLPPLVGRVLTAQDGKPESPPVAVLRHRAWVKLFGADPGVIGSVVLLNGEPRTIVGVMPPRFTWHAADVWIPVRSASRDTGAGALNFQARLRPRVSTDQAEAQLATIARNRASQHPDDYPDGFRLRVPYVIDEVVGDFKRVLFSLLAAVGLLMFIACCNVANMLLARATAREREMTLRAALGAGRGRLIRQLLVESGLLAGAGAVGGILLAFGGLRALVPLLPEGPLPGEIEIALNGPVLLISVGTAAVSGILFGLAPALFGARSDLVDGLKSGGGRDGGDGRRGLRSALVIAEVALSVVLVLSSGLLLRSFLTLATQDLGFDPRHIVAVRPAFAPRTYVESSERRRFYRQWIERIGALPGVARVAAVSGLPPWGGYRSEVVVFGQRHDPGSTTLVRHCTDGFFETLGIPLVRGRGLAEDARDQPHAIAVVNQAFVRTYLDGVEPVGRHIQVAVNTTPGGTPAPSTFEIVGVAADVRNQGIKEPPSPEVFLPGLAAGTSLVLVRASIDAAGVIGAIRHELRQLDRQVALTELALPDLLNRNFYAQPRFSFIVLAAFSLAGMLLVAIGVYSVLAYTVARQTRDIAVRLALGARRMAVCGMVLRWAGTLVAIGIGLGLAAALATTRLLADQLWQTSPQDVPSIVATVVLVSVVALIACLVPARRAMRVELMSALRQD